jgi:sugar lactone lactonase YvrE
LKRLSFSLGGLSMRSLTRIGLAFLFVAQVSLNGFAQSGIIATVAGNGSIGYSGDGGPATSAQFRFPGGLALDAAGNLFIADINNHCIRKVTPGGVISTVAGNGKAGYSGDGGPATSAQLSNPSGIVVDSTNNLFIADYNNHRVRKVTSGGLISTVAGNGIQGYSGDGGPATSAQLSGPHKLALDAAGNLFIADLGNQCIRKVTSDGVISTVAGNKAQGQGYSGDDGPATSAQLNFPVGVALDATGNLFIADSGNNRIRKVTPGGIISTVAGNGNAGYSGDGGPPTSALLSGSKGVALDVTGNLFIADSGNNRIRKVTPGGIISTVAGNGNAGYSGDGGPANSAQLSGPTGIVVDSAGNLFIADFSNQCIRKVTALNSSAIFFPQVAIGGGWSTSFMLANTGLTAISGNLILTDNQGNPFTVNSSSLGIGYSFPISIPAGGVMFLNTNQVEANAPTKVGWAMAESYNGAVNGVATYQSVSQGIVQTATGVLSSQSTQFATIPVNEDNSKNLKTAYAIANPTDQVLVVKVALADPNGVVVDDTVSMTLNPGQQIARYFDQNYSNRPIFQGSMVLRAQGGGTFIIVALVQNQQFFTAIPVIPNKAPNIPD